MRVDLLLEAARRTGWRRVSLSVTGEQTPQGAMDKLAKEMDNVLARSWPVGSAARARVNDGERPP
jgi:hypothetical protein